ncbi:hypothetical protein ECKD1_20840 [Escherichia coli KD1]|nr:hypothetical protein ECKD1_20840 [Escherichia coli KD1]
MKVAIKSLFIGSTVEAIQEERIKSQLFALTVATQTVMK